MSSSNAAVLLRGRQVITMEPNECQKQLPMAACMPVRFMIWNIAIIKMKNRMMQNSYSAEESRPPGETCFS
jgi:hypothetical protein